MNLKETWENIAYKDSTKETNTKIKTLETDTLKLNVNQPQLLSIPETPQRFTEKTKKIKPVAKTKIFTPTPEDSISFNLITRKPEKNIINQTLVHDYLNPLPLGDRQWLNNHINNLTVIKTTDIASDKASSTDTISHQINSITDTVLPHSENPENLNKAFQQTVIVDSIQNSATIKNNNTEVKDTEQTSIEIPSIIPISDNRNLDKDILSGLLLLAVAITGFLRVTNYKYLRELFSALIFSQNARKMQKTVNLHYQTPAFILNGLFLFNTAIFLYQIINFYNLKTIFNQSLLLIPAFMTLLIAYGLIKVALYRFVAYIFETTLETKEYLFFNLLNNKIFAIAILPIIIVVPYIESDIVPILFKIGGVIFISLYFMQLFRGLSIILKNLASLFYMFLYLCALEFLPLIIIYNILIR